MTTEAEKAAEEWVREKTSWVGEGDLFLAEASDCKRAYLAGHASRDGEVAKLEARVAELEKKEVELMQAGRVLAIDAMILQDEKDRDQKFEDEVRKYDNQK